MTPAEKTIKENVANCIDDIEAAIEGYDLAVFMTAITHVLASVACTSNTLASGESMADLLALKIKEITREHYAACRPPAGSA